MHYDIREICFEKASNSNRLTDFCDRSAPNDLVCLGHFDMIQIRKVQSKSTPFHAIQSAIKEKQKTPKEYQYPLYILCEMDTNDQAAKLDYFWTVPSAFTSIARLHCDHMDTYDGQPFSAMLEDRCKERISQDNKQVIKCISGEESRSYTKLCVTLYSSPQQTFTVDVAIYDSLELGDVVAAIKGDSLAAVLEVQRHLYESPAVSDAYSYTGINKEMFSSKDPQFYQNWQGRIGDSALRYAATRATVKNAQAAERALTDLGANDHQGVFFVVGTADMIIEWEKVKGGTKQNGIREVDFMEYMRKSVFKEDTMQPAFIDMITRTGIDSVAPYRSRGQGVKGEQTSHYHLNDDVLMLDANKIWHYQLRSLLNTLEAMNGNSVIDALSKLVKPGVEAMVYRLNDLSKQPSDFWRNRFSEGDILEFIDSIISLLNDLFHLECQLVQHPELTPIRYYVPAMILRFIMCWVERCSETITELDGRGTKEAGAQLSSLLIPKAVENASTRCLLDPWQDEQSHHAGKATLRVNVPINKLYEPWEMLHILCHEMAHYCGDSIRNREKRLKHITFCTARYMVGLMDSIIEKKLEEPTKGPILEYIAGRILQNYNLGTRWSKEYVETIKNCLPNSAKQIFVSAQIQDQYVRNVFKNGRGAKYLNVIHSAQRLRDYTVLANSTKNLEDHIVFCLCHLYKECYADIVMILLMDCSCENYFRCVYQDELERIKGNDEKIETQELHYNRLALVCIAINRIKGGSFLTEAAMSVLPKDVHEKIKKQEAKQWYNSEKCTQSNSWVCLFAEEADEILSYLQECAWEFYTQLNEEGNPQKVSNLRDIAKNVNKTSFNWKNIRDFVESSTTADSQTSC